jgi:hypothetical protein
LGDPLGLAFDKNDNLYVADYTAGTIWKFSAGGVKSSYATGIFHVDGIALDPAGNLFASGYSDGRLTKVAPNGTKSTFATGLIGPVGVACDAAGNIFVAERDGGRISQFTPDGARSTFSTDLGSPYGLAFDAAGNLFASDQFSSMIVKLSANGTGTTFATINGEAGFLTFEPATGVMQNLSTRAQVLTGDRVLIGGIIISGSDPKKIAVRAIGPSLAAAGVNGSLQDPIVRLVDSKGGVVAENDDWKQTQQSDVQALGLAPQDERESAIVATLAPGAYTAVVTGKSDTSGVGLVEFYDLAAGSASSLANISTRGFVGSGENVLIGGFIIGNGNGAKVVVRGIGPSLGQAGVANPLSDPVVALHDSNGSVRATNNNWRDTQELAIQATALAPSDAAESAILTALPPGGYTAIVSGNSGATGVGLVEVFRVN